MIAEIGPVDFEMPRDGDGSLEPKRRPRHLDGTVSPLRSGAFRTDALLWLRVGEVSVLSGDPRKEIGER